MDGASRMFAAPTELTLGGRTLQVDPRVAHLRGQIEQHILESKPNPLEVARNNVELFSGSPDMQAELLKLGMQEACRAKSVTRMEFVEWINTVEGTIYVLWLQTRACNSPPPTLDEIKGLYDDDLETVIQQLGAASTEEDVADAAESVLQKIQDKMNRASGEDELGNSTGPPNGAGQTSPSPGDESAVS